MKGTNLNYTLTFGLNLDKNCSVLKDIFNTGFRIQYLKSLNNLEIIKDQNKTYF